MITERVSERFDDQVVIKVRPSTKHIVHLTTYHGVDEVNGKTVPTVSYGYCEAWSPNPVCPCGQLFVEWCEEPHA